MMTDKKLRDLSSTWLSPMDLVLADLLDKSQRMTIGAFNAEVEKVITAIPQMFGMLDRQAFIDALEEEIGAAMLKGLEQ